MFVSNELLRTNGPGKWNNISKNKTDFVNKNKSFSGLKVSSIFDCSTKDGSPVF